MSAVPDGLLLVVALAGGALDLATRRIPNWLTFPAAAVGLAWNGYRGGWRGLLLALGGLALGFVVFLPFFALGGMGAGDVKLMAAVGAITGPQALVAIFILTGLLGGIAGLALAAARGRLRVTLANTAHLLAQLGRLHWEEARRTAGAVAAKDASLPVGVVASNGASPDVRLRLPYGAVIAGGCVLFLLTRA